VKDGRRNRYEIRAELPLPEPASRQPSIGELLALLTGTRLTWRAPARDEK